MKKIKDVISIGELKFIPVIVDEKGLEKKYQTDYCIFCMFAPRNEFGKLIEASCTMRKLSISCGVQYCGYYKSIEDGV